MTDLYIRPYDAPDVRRRVLFIVAGIAILAVAVGLLLRRGCASGPREAGALAQSVEEDPFVDELLALPDPAPPAQPPGPEPPPRSTEPGEETGRDPGARLYAVAQSARAQGNLLKAREAALRILGDSHDVTARQGAAALLGEVNLELVGSPRPMQEKTEYTVQGGDSLARLAKKFNTTIELIQQGNNISGSLIRIGDRLRIFSGDFKISIDKSDNVLDLYLNGQFFKRYAVGTGEHNQTPVGEFKIADRIRHPPWWRDGKLIPYGDPANELGTHWLSLNVKGYGIHGTWEPETIGKQSSAGCVRLLNENIEELYALVPVGTPVTITD